MVEVLGYKPRITSGARTVAHNASVGGVPGSSHIGCWAADLALDGVNADVLVKAAQEAGFERIGIYPSHVHVDNDPSKDPAIWYGNYV